jgi:hypothetical protein
MSESAGGLYYKSLGAHRSKTITMVARTLKGAGGKLWNHATATGRGVAAAHAKQWVRVIRAAVNPVAVTG